MQNAIKTKRNLKTVMINEWMNNDIEITKNKIEKSIPRHKKSQK